MPPKQKPNISKNPIQSRKPPFFAKVFRAINDLKENKGATVAQIAKEVHSKLKQLGLKTNSRNVLMQVRRSLEFGINSKILEERAGKFRLVPLVKKNLMSTDSSEITAIIKKSFQIAKNPVIKKNIRNIKKLDKDKDKHKSICLFCNKPIINRARHRSCAKSQRIIQKRREQLQKIMRKNKSQEPSAAPSNEKVEKENSLNVTEKKSSISRGIYYESELPVEQNPSECNTRETFSNVGPLEKMSLSEYALQRNTNSSLNTDRRKQKQQPKKRKRRKRSRIYSRQRDDGFLSNVSTSSVLAASVMILMSIWYGYH